jgi:hypothetical protein
MKLDDMAEKARCSERRRLACLVVLMVLAAGLSMLFAWLSGRGETW